MNENNYKRGIFLAAAVFLVVFISYTLPAALQSGDILEAILGGFVNPYAAGYATDAICTWFILLFWIIYEAKTQNIRHGWICAVLGAFPGVAVGLALYLIIRQKQLSAS